MIDYETSVIGSLLIDPIPVLPIVRGKLGKEDFTLAINQAVFTAACKLADEDKPVDPVTIKAACGVSSDYLVEMMNNTPTAANIEAYIDGMIEKTMRRRLYELSDSVSQQLTEGGAPQEVCTFIQESAEKIAEQQSASDLISSLDACMDFYGYLSEVGGGKVKPYVPSGYTALDELLGGGFVKEGLYILAARPGCGKTTLAIQMAEKVAKTGKPVLFMSLEMSKRQITAKRVSAFTNIGYTKVITAELTQSENAKVAEACGTLAERPLIINKRAGASVDDIAFLARQVKGLEFIVIDYLGLIRHKGGKSIYEQVTETSNSLKRLARNLGVPILCLAQLNREVESRADGKPRTSDLRDSGAIEQDADGILLLSRDMQPQEGMAPAELLCQVGKNRHGRVGEVKFNFYLTNGGIYPQFGG